MTKKPMRGERTAKHIGKKIAAETSKKQAKPASSKTAAMKMGDLMYKKAHRTVAMTESQKKRTRPTFR